MNNLQFGKINKKLKLTTTMIKWTILHRSSFRIRVSKINNYLTKSNNNQKSQKLQLIQEGEMYVPF
jgi:hypothetical protein